MCKLLGVNRSMIYYKNKPKQSALDIDNEVCEIFHKSRRNYGTRKIKVELAKRGIIASRRRIGKSMKRLGPISKYTKRNLKNCKKHVNRANVENIVDRKFKERRSLEVLVSDLTYVKILGKWVYICLITDLSN